jgi:uncharacterized membrane-anchored protein
VIRLFLAAVLLLVPLAPAFAYVDPGTGSMVIQIVIAALVGGAAFIGAFWRKLFRRRRDRNAARPDTERD